MASPRFPVVSHICLWGLVCAVWGCLGGEDDLLWGAPRALVQVSPPGPGTVRDAELLCHDVAELRVCWSQSGGCRTGCTVPRVVAQGPLPARAQRCVPREPFGEQGFRCMSRAGGGEGAFRCQARVCTQDAIYLPSPDEWECIDDHGALRCRQIAEAAGIPPGPVAPGFVCGQRRGAAAERICVDLSPLQPAATHQRCQVRHVGGRMLRSCQRGQVPRLGAACEAEEDCPAGAPCAGGYCLPPQPLPNCWYDMDCSTGQACRFGVCVG